MEPYQITLVLIVVALLFAGNSVFKHYLEHQKDRRREEAATERQREVLEHARFASRQETQCMELLVEAMKRDANLPYVREHSEEAKRALLAGIATTPTTRVGDTDVPGIVAEELNKVARRAGREFKTTGTYRILRVDTTTPEGFRVRVQDATTGEEMAVGVDDATRTEGVREKLRHAEWGKTEINLTIQGRKRESGAVVDARVIDATLPEEAEA